LGAVERFVESVENTLPDEARVVKTIGDEVMVVGSDPAALTDWAVGFQTLIDERPLPRIGIHYGETLYRDGDYYGREVNQAARVAARAAGGEVLVTRPVVEQAGPHLEFQPIGEVRLKGFREPTELFLARAADAGAYCAELCARLGVRLVVERAAAPRRGNLHAWARDLRYGAAARLALARGARVATGHTASDQAETVLYRLAASPGRRALLGMRARDGRLVRPLLEVTRAQTAAY